MDVSTLTSLLHEAEEHHGKYEAIAAPMNGRAGTPRLSSRVNRAAHRSRRTTTPSSTSREEGSNRPGPPDVMTSVLRRSAPGRDTRRTTAPSSGPPGCSAFPRSWYAAAARSSA
jgi:hypothetical protein